MLGFDDTTSRPLWFEQGDAIYGHTLTTTEFLAEESDQPPHRLLLLRAAADRVPAATGARGADRTVAPTHRTKPGGSPSPAPGLNFDGAA